jgi:chorismate synthase
VAVGAICKQLLDLFEVSVGGYVISIGEVNSTLDGIPIAERVGIAESNNVRCPDPEAAKKMGERIRQVMKDRDTLGGVIEVIALGVPPGLGSHVHWDRRLDARLGAAVLSVQAIKGVEIGPAFENTRRQGTQTQDPIQIKGKELIRSTNRAGGLEGGITNGNPLVIRAAMKPIATTLISQQTVDLFSEMEVPSQYERSDYCPVPRAVPIIEAMVAYVIADALLEKLGGDSIGEIQERFTQLRRTNLSDLRMDGEEHIYWPSEE